MSRCPACFHEPFDVAGRCAVPIGDNTICGCPADAHANRAVQPALPRVYDFTTAAPNTRSTLARPAA